MADGLAGARADQAVRARQLDRLEGSRPTARSTDGLAPVLPTGLTIAWSYATPPSDDAVVEVDVVRAVRVLRGDGRGDRPGRLLRRRRRIARRDAASSRSRWRRWRRGRASRRAAAPACSTGVELRRRARRGCCRRSRSRRSGRSGPTGCRRPSRSRRPSCRRARPLRRSCPPGARRRRRTTSSSRTSRRRGWNVLFVEPCSDGYVPVAIVYQPTPVFGGKAWHHAVVAGHAVLHQLLVGRHGAGLGVLLHQVGAHAVRREHARPCRPDGRRPSSRPAAPAPIVRTTNAVAPQSAVASQRRPRFMCLPPSSPS